MRLVCISDFDMRGSGYFNIATNLCAGLAGLGHEIKALGLGYRREEHNFPFSILPAESYMDVRAMYQNIAYLWRPEAMIMALDIPHQRRAVKDFMPFGIPHIGIMAVEADPLCISWAMSLMQMKKVFIISEFGAEEARKVGVPAEHIQIGIDTESWRSPTADERTNLRGAFGLDEDEFVILTVADNQERKHLTRAMEIVAEFAKTGAKYRYILVTREHFVAGYELRDYARTEGIDSRLMIFERGMKFEELWSLFAVSDAFLLPSKAEGLGMPMLEAMSVGIPCLATDCTAMHELLTDGRGFPIPWDYVHVDPFGNEHRYFASIIRGAKLLEGVYNKGVDVESAVRKARSFVDNRKWEIPVKQLDNALKGMKDDSADTENQS